ncbi:hypothetical protein JW964_17280 [candidate division KSB1 bacterium]|nr:hypothetical protein [candidate division KSB1 bacterium]
MDKFCHSCGMMLSIPGAQGPAENFCSYCSDEKGQLKPKNEIQAGIAQWLQSMQPSIPLEKAQQRAEFYLKAMPAWAE